MYMSGSWQIAQFDKTIGNAFDWVAVPNPCGPGGCTGMPGGAGLVAIKTTKDPKAVAKVMEYLASEDVLRNSTAARCSCRAISACRPRASTIPPQARSPRRRSTSSPSEVGEIAPLANQLQGYPYNRSCSTP